MIHLRITVDHRERAGGLVDALAALWSEVAVGCLPVGDVVIGRRVIVERKTVHDLVQSIADGRLFRQLHALAGEAARPLLVVEGHDSLPAAGLGPEALRGVLLSVAVGYRVPMLRTLDVEETALYVARIARRESKREERAPQPRPRDGPLAVLAAIPGVGEVRAGTLLERFGSLRGVLDADEATLRSVPGIGAGSARQILDTLDVDRTGDRDGSGGQGEQE